MSPHEHIISLEEVLYDQPTGRLALVFELMDANLYELIRGRRHFLNPQLINSYMWQLMKSLDHMHKKGIFHRDIKPENILIESTSDVGRGLKLADFGSCRGIYSKQPYTEYISTRWYRAPECLLTDGYYGPEMDLWGAGCVMFEITSLYPLFPGSNETDQITRIHKVLGTPSGELLQKLKAKGAAHISFDFAAYKGVGLQQLIPHASADAIDLLVKLLKYDASERITAREAMRHPYFREIRESEVKRMASMNANASSNESKHDGAPAAAKASQGQPVIIKQGNQTYNQVGNSDANANQYKMYHQQQSVQKGLPNIGLQGSALHSSEQQQKQYGEYHHQPVVVKTLHTIKSNQVQPANPSSLPPILGNNMQQMQQQKQYMDQKSLRALQPSNQEKKRKKYKLNYAQRGGQTNQQEQVMRAYGITSKQAMGDEASAKLAATGAGPNANSSYNSHPNRHYIAAKKP